MLGPAGPQHCEKHRVPVCSTYWKDGIHSNQRPFLSIRGGHLRKIDDRYEPATPTPATKAYASPSTTRHGPHQNPPTMWIHPLHRLTKWRRKLKTAPPQISQRAPAAWNTLHPRGESKVGQETTREPQNTMLTIAAMIKK